MKQAIASPLLEDATVDGATGLLINITGPKDLTLNEINEAITLVQESADPDAEIIFGSLINEDAKSDTVKITLIATGFAPKDNAAKRPGAATSMATRPPPTRQEEFKMSAPPSRTTRVAPLMPGEKTVTRPPTPALDQSVTVPAGTPAVDEDRWDIPTFLRKQAGEP
jgi:cell division protein FtsZ